MTCFYTQTICSSFLVILLLFVINTVKNACNQSTVPSEQKSVKNENELMMTTFFTQIFWT